MLRTALATLRFRWASFAGAALALVLGSGVAAMMITTLVAASVTPFPGPQRFAAAPAVVVPGTSLRLRVDGVTAALPVLPPEPLSPLLVRRLAATGKVVADRTFPVQQAGGPPGQVGHPWQAAAFTPYRLVAGHPPATSDQVVIGGGSPRLVGHRVRVTTPAGTAVYLVSGVTAPVWFEHAVFFSRAAAARLSRAIDAIVAYGPLSAVLRAVHADRASAQVLTGGARKQADPDPSGGTDQLSSAQAMAGTSTLLGVSVAVFVVAATFAFATEQRRREVGLLRAVGATPRQVRRMIIAEAALVGLLASGTGCVLGALATPALRSWMTSHGVAPAWFSVPVTARPLLIAFAIGVASALAGATAASRRAALLRPGEALRDAVASLRVMTGTRWVLGIGLLAGGVYSGRAIIAGGPGNAMILKDDMPALVLVVTGCAVLAPVLARPVARAVAGPLARGGAGLVGVGPMVVRQNVLWAARRTAATAAPVVLALGLAIAMLTLEASANAAARAAVLRTYGTDLVVVPAGSAGLSTRAVSAVRAVPGAQATVLTPVQVTLATSSGDYIATLTAQAATRATLADTQHLTVASGSLTRLPGDFLIVDQRTATVDGLRAGQSLTGYLPDRTRVPLRIAAVIRTGMTQPTVYLSASHAAGQPPGQIDVAARRPEAFAAVASALRAAARGSGARVVSARRLTATPRTTHDQAQNRQATAVILGMALIYCIIAIANTMMIAATARTREIAALRLAGATRRQVLGLVTAESALTAAIGAIVAAVAAAVVICGQHAALTRFANAAPVVIAWQPISEIAAACLAVAVTASALSAPRALRKRLIELTAQRE